MVCDGASGVLVTSRKNAEKKGYTKAVVPLGYGERTFYNADKVAVDDPSVRARRLLLCARTLLILETGLHLLGLRTLERM